METGACLPRRCITFSLNNTRLAFGKRGHNLLQLWKWTSISFLHSQVSAVSFCGLLWTADFSGCRLLFQIVAPTPWSLMLDKKMYLPVVRLKEVNRAGCRIVPFIFFIQTSTSLLWWLAKDDMECYSKFRFACIKSSLLKMFAKV